MNFDGELLADRYRLGPRVGRGAQAVTRLARDERSGAVVVIKQLRLRDGADWKRFDLFEREVRTLRALDHPGVPRYLDTFESEPGCFNLVMERAPGATLWAYSKKHRFDERELRAILVQALDILRYLHGRRPPVVHRDIKPANLIRAADGKVALVDFGGVKDAGRPEGGSTVIGTFGFMAPEQLHGEATPATDLYSLGATIVALAGGVDPEHVPRRGLRMDLDRHLPALDPALRGVLQSMVEPDPAQRARSAAAVQDRLAATAAPRRLEGDRAAALAVRPASDRIAEDVAGMLAGLPRPMRPVMRVMISLLAMGGYVSALALRVVLVPIVYALATAVISDRHRPRLAGLRGTVEGELDRAGAGLRAVARGRRRALPAARPAR